MADKFVQFLIEVFKVFGEMYIDTKRPKPPRNLHIKIGRTE